MTIKEISIPELLSMIAPTPQKARDLATFFNPPMDETTKRLQGALLGHHKSVRTQVIGNAATRKSNNDT